MAATYLILAAIACLLIYSLRWAFNTQLASIPGPLVGRFSRLYRTSMVARGKAPEEYRKVHATYGPVVRIGPKHVSIADIDAIPTIYGVGSKFLKTPFYKTMAVVYKEKTIDSMFTARDPAIHKALKSPVANMFSMSSMRSYEVYVDECTDIFVSTMRELQGQTIELAEWLQWYAFDVIAGITFQRRFGFLEQRKDVDHMIRDLDRGLSAIKILGQYPELDGPAKFLLRKVLGMVGFKDPLVRFLELCDDEILRYDRSSAEKDSRTDFLSQLRNRSGSIGPGSVHENLINHLGNNLLAGSDTTAISLRACFYYLLRHPRVLGKLQEECDACVAAGTLSKVATLEETLRMPYLQAVIKEAMRLHPGVGFPLERYVPEGGAVISGYSIPAGTIVSISAPVVQMDQKVFGTDADEFRPERWLEAGDEQLLLMNRATLAFGHGARTYIGKNISMMEMSKFITQIFRTFDLRFVQANHEWKTEAAWFWKQYDMPVVFTAKAQ